MTLELYLKALDTITKLLPFLKSFTGERRRDYYEKLLKPLFESFEEIHHFYHELILETRSKIVSLPKTFQLELTLESFAKLEKIKEEFLALRTKDEGLRDCFRQDAQADFESVRWAEERRCLASIMYYFLGIPGIPPSDSELDNTIKAVIEKGGITYWETPSVRLYLDIRDSRDPDYIIERLDQSRAKLNELYMNARKHYRNVQNAIVMKT